MLKRCKQIMRIFLAIALIILPVLGNANVASADADEVITIFHTNDIHGAVEDLSYVKTMKETTPNSLLVDAGDATQGSALATYTEGEAVIDLMNLAGYDVMTPGNHEFDYGTPKAISNAEKANFPVISANTFNKNGDLLFEGINGNNGQNLIVESDQDTKIGFFGITTTETRYKTNPDKLGGTTFGSEIQYAQEQVDDLKMQGADIIIGIMHVGVDASSDPITDTIAREVDGIDVIIDGHSHTQYQKVIDGTGTTLDKTYIVQTGTKLQSIGEIKLYVDSNTNTLENIETDLIYDFKDNYVADVDYSDAYQEKIGELAPIFNRVVTNSKTKIFNFAEDLEANRTWSSSRMEETPAGDLVADAMQYTGEYLVSLFDEYKDYPVVTLQNGGGVRANIDAGEVTVEKIFDVLPFGNLIAIKEITPDVLYKALENGYSKMAYDIEGFIDPSAADGRFAQIAGMRTMIDIEQPVGSRVKEIYLVDANGKETLLSKNDTTTKIALVSNDYEIAGGDGYDMLGTLPHIAEGGALEVVLEDYINNHSKNGTFTYAKTSGRIKVAQIETIQHTGYVKVIPTITLAPNTEYTILVDGVEEVKTITDAVGNFSLVLTNGMHTLSIGNDDYYISSYTNMNILNMEVIEKPVTPNPEPEIPGIVPAPDGGSKTTNVTDTSDTTTILPSLIFCIIASGYLASQKRREDI